MGSLQDLAEWYILVSLRLVIFSLENFLLSRLQPVCATKNRLIISQVLCDILIFAYIFEKENILTFVLYFFLNKHEKNVKGSLIATQGLPYKQIVPTKSYV